LYLDVYGPNVQSVTMMTDRMLFLLLLLPSTLAIAPISRSMLPVTFCCPEGEIMETTSKILLDMEFASAQCVPLNGSESIEWSTVMALDPTKGGNDEGRYVEMSLRKKGEMNINCGNVAHAKILLSSVFEGYENSTEDANEVSDLIELRGCEDGDHCGSVYIEGRPICDDEWETSDATVACRMLGYDYGYPVSNSFYTYKDIDERYRMDNVQCMGDESSLYDCEYSRRDNCGRDEVAGVVCHKDEPDDYGPSSSSRDPGPEDDALTVDGGIRTRSGKMVEADTFCVGALKGESFKRKMWVWAVSCSPRQVVPILRTALQQQLFRPGGPHGNLEIHHRFYYWFPANVARLAEKNGQNGLQEAEYTDYIKGLERDIFNILDTDGKGSIEVKSSVEEPSIGIEPFNAILGHIFRFFDLNNDNILSVTEDIMDIVVKHRFPGRHDQGAEYNFQRELDLNNDGIWTIGELVGREPITWPYPLYQLYSSIDVNQDEAVDLTTEARPFLEKVFTMFDVNKNGLVTAKEVLAVINKTNIVPEERMVAMQIVLDKYATLAEFLVREIIKTADINSDMKTTFEEILQFDDWNFIEKTLIPAVTYIGNPSISGPLGAAIGIDITRSHHFRYEEERAALGFGLKLLLGLLEEM